MRLFALTITVLLLTSACNLATQPTTPAAESTELPAAPTELALTPLAGGSPQPQTAGTPGTTRTPFGSDAPPTSQSIAPTNTFATPASGARVEITSPASGAAVSGSPLYVSGVAHNLPQDQFTLQVFDASSQPISNAQTITLSNPNHVADVPWSASITLRSYTGAAQVRISAQTAAGANSVIGAVDVTIAPSSATSVVQPVTGNAVAGIFTPANNSTVSGDPISVTGTAGGMADNQFTLLLLDSSGTVINSQLITLSGAEQNVVPWSASLGTSGYKGQAEIRAVLVKDGQQSTLTSVTVTLQ